MRILKFLSCFSVFGLVIACSSTNKIENIDTDPFQLFKEGKREIIAENYKSAISKFELIEREHPASDYAAKALINRAYAHYLNSNYDEAIFAAEDFIRQYPADREIAYMHYLKAIAKYEQIINIGRDQQVAAEALEALVEVFEKFPNTKYARDAKLKYDLAFNHLAGKEMDVGRFYLKRNHIQAAINRFRIVVNKYNTSIFIPEALYRLVECYYSIGVKKEAQKYAAVLGYNYPNTEWYTKAYKIINRNQP